MDHRRKNIIGTTVTPLEVEVGGSLAKTLAVCRGRLLWRRERYRDSMERGPQRRRSARTSGGDAKRHRSRPMLKCTARALRKPRLVGSGLNQEWQKTYGAARLLVRIPYWSEQRPKSNKVHAQRGENSHHHHHHHHSHNHHHNHHHQKRFGIDRDTNRNEFMIHIL